MKYRPYIFEYTYSPDILDKQGGTREQDGHVNSTRNGGEGRGATQATVAKGEDF